MRFNLQDTKKTVQRRNGQLSVSLHFLRPGELHAEIARLIAYHEQLVGCPQGQFSVDDARACIGEYRLAHCLLATLSHWYSWRAREWAEVVQELGVTSELNTIPSALHLRLALYDYVNEHYAGFLDAQTRNDALHSFAAQYHLTVSNLEYLLVLDTEDEAVLTRESTEPPTTQEVALLYNQWAFEAALFTASHVRFVVDCNAFSVSDGLTTSLDQNAHALSTVSAVSIGVGAVIKRLSYMARKLGVYYDISYDQHGDSGRESGSHGRGQAIAPTMLRGKDESSPTSAAPLLTLTLYGPQEVTGAAQQYGSRLARLCRMLLGYGTLHNEQGKKNKKVSLSGAIAEAEATIHFLQRSYTFRMDNNVLQVIGIEGGEKQRIGKTDTTDATAPLNVSAEQAASVFDSSIEQSFSEAFAALAQSQGVDGWRLEREPEPLLVQHGIFIPDFAFTRAHHRVYVEILGFWTPSYRERKLQRLLELRERADLLLAIPIEAKEAYTSIAQSFPIVYYDGQLSATEVINALRNRYDDFPERLARIDVAAVQALVKREGVLTETRCYSLLHCYRRSELLKAAENVSGDDVLFLPGVGLYQKTWLEELKAEVLLWLHSISGRALPQVLRAMRERWPALATSEDAALETLLTLWSDTLRIQRNSLFEATVTSIDSSEDTTQDESAYVPTTSVKEGKKQVRERRSALKKSVGSDPQERQGDLWG